MHEKCHSLLGKRVCLLIIASALHFQVAMVPIPFPPLGAPFRRSASASKTNNTLQPPTTDVIMIIRRTKSIISFRRTE